MSNLGKRTFSCLLTQIQAIQPVRPANPTTIKQALQLLRAEQNQGIYAKVVVNGKPFTVTVGDLLCTHRLKATQIGDVIRIRQAFELGTASFILRQRPNSSIQLPDREELHAKAQELSLHIASYEQSRRLFLNPAYHCIEATVVGNERGDKVHRKIVYRRKIQLPTKNLKPHVTLLRIKSIQINADCL